MSSPAEQAESRPALLARLVRVLTGVQEALLDQVAHERARYTALGGVVLGTATIAALSMTLGLSEVLGGFNVVLLLPALVWGAFVLNLDRWLVSSSAGTGVWRRARLFAPRFVLAVCFGIVIAEPLVLRIFQTAIEQRIENQRDQSRRDLASVLLRCNPDPADAGEVRSHPGNAVCGRYRLNLTAEQDAVAGELAGLQRQADTLQRGIAVDSAEQARRDRLARDECAGTPGPGLTGKAGRGPECKRREAEATGFARTHSTVDRSNRLATLQKRITGLHQKQDTMRRTFVDRRNAEIHRQVGELRRHQGPIGLLERFRALDELTGTNRFLFVATWFVRAFFILIDSLPVLVKLFGGVTGYDERVDMLEASAKRIFKRKVDTDEVCRMLELDATKLDAENKAEQRRAASQHELRRNMARLDRELEQHIDELARQFQATSASNGSSVNGIGEP